MSLTDARGFLVVPSGTKKVISVLFGFMPTDLNSRHFILTFADQETGVRKRAAHFELVDDIARKTHWPGRALRPEHRPASVWQAQNGIGL